VTTTEAKAPQKAPASPPAPTDLPGLRLEVIHKRMDWVKARRSGGNVLAGMPLLFAKINTFRPQRAFMHYNLQRGPLLSAGIGFRMFFSITGLLATGFSLAGLILNGQPALLEQVIRSVAGAAPGLLKVNGGPGLVDPHSCSTRPTSAGPP